MTRQSVPGRMFIEFMAASALCFWIVSLPASAVDGLVLDSSHIIFHYHGQDTTSYAGICISSIRDINHDGFDDIAVSSWSPRGTLIFRGGNPADTVPFVMLRGPHGPATSIDLDGDGIRDVVTSEEYSPYVNPYGVILFYRGYADSIATTPFDSIFPSPPNWDFGVQFQSKVLEGDTVASLLTIAPNDPAGPKLMFFKTPLTKKIPDWSAQYSFYLDIHVGFGFVDFNGDGHRDIFIGLSSPRPTLPSQVCIYYGPNFPALPNVVLQAPVFADSTLVETFAGGVFNVGDIDGDGWEDLAVEYSGKILIYRCGPTADTLYDYLLSQPYKTAAAAGDINGDGQPDLVAGDYMKSWYGGVQVYLGGSQWDVTPDGSLGHDYLPPLFLLNIGWRVASAGDFNGDGIEDFMFSCNNFAYGHPGDVFVVKGGRDIVTDVKDTQLHMVASDSLNLSVYPNPFNPNTTVTFFLPRPCPTSLTVVNVLGQEIATLMKEVILQSGSYSYSWDGNQSDGTPSPSGTYFVRLVTAGRLHTQKMMRVR